jgi:hypothetical protein
MTARALMSLLALLALVSYETKMASAQVGSVRRDPATGDYLVQIRTENGGTADVRIPPRNRVMGEVAVTASGMTGGTVGYEYVVRVLPSSPQGLSRLELPCPSSIVGRRVVAVSYSAAHGRAPLQFDVGALRCVGLAGLEAGDSMRVTLQSESLPSISRVALIGFADVPQWPCECWGDPENEPAVAAIDTLDGSEGGWTSVLSLAPVRAPDVVGTPQATVLHLQSDLWLSCGPLALITNPGICTSLRAKLDAAAEAIARGNVNGARGPLGAFLNELEVQRGKAVSRLAFTLLSFYAQRLSQQLAH